MPMMNTEKANPLKASMHCISIPHVRQGQIRQCPTLQRTVITTKSQPIEADPSQSAQTE